MLLTNRRLGLIYFCLAGMEVAWFTPFFLLFYRSVNQISPFGIFLGLFGVLLVFLLTLEILNLFQLFVQIRLQSLFSDSEIHQFPFKLSQHFCYLRFNFGSPLLDKFLDGNRTQLVSDLSQSFLGLLDGFIQLRDFVLLFLRRVRADT